MGWHAADGPDEGEGAADGPDEAEGAADGPDEGEGAADGPDEGQGAADGPDEGEGAAVAADPGRRQQEADLVYQMRMKTKQKRTKTQLYLEGRPGHDVHVGGVALDGVGGPEVGRGLLAAVGHG